MYINNLITLTLHLRLLVHTKINACSKSLTSGSDNVCSAISYLYSRYFSTYSLKCNDRIGKPPRGRGGWIGDYRYIYKITYLQ